MFVANDFSRAFIENVYAEAFAQGVTIGELERAAGVCSGYLSHIRKDHAIIPGLDKAAAIARRLGVPLDSLLLEEYSVGKGKAAS